MKAVRINSLSTYFNSIKVQLEQKGIPRRSLFLPFQFHKGTIRTFARFLVMKAEQHFNSIKVQLEPSMSRYMFQGS